MMIKPGNFLFFFFISILTGSCFDVQAQRILHRRISIYAAQTPVGEVLKQLESRGKFSFSFNSDKIPVDSLVSISSDDVSIKEVLNTIFNNQFEYKESADYIIIRYAPYRLSFVPEKVLRSEKNIRISGFVQDDISGLHLPDASVYNKKFLRSALSGKNGYFKLKIKTNQPAVALTLSKEMYRDTTVMVLSDVKVNPVADTSEQYGYNSHRNTRARFARFFTSSKQRVQDANIGNFFANSPYQVSFIPGLSSHGLMSSRVVNKVSVNMLGGYTAGVNGLEVGGLFNISKKNVRYAQFAGIFNLVGQSVNGVQAAGISNVVIENFKGSQVAGISNSLIGKLEGAQIAGILNHAHDSVSGAQVAGILNFSQRNLNGTQVAGILNVSKSVRGVQVAGISNMTLGSTGPQVAGILNVSGAALGGQTSGIANISFRKLTGSQIGLFNVANKVQGAQIGLFNIADSISGYAIGLISLARKGGYHSLTVSSSELHQTNYSLKTGTSRLYTLLQFGTNTGGGKKLNSYGVGIGKEIHLYKALYLNPEISQSQIYQGKRKDVNMLAKINPLLYFKPNKYISLFAGPSVNAYYSNQLTRHEGYAFVKEDIRNFRLGNSQWRGWFGWSAGISVF